MSDDRKPQLLLVDDESRILSALRRALRREGYEIHLAETAAEALAVVETTRLDAVLSDYKMPGMTGLQLLVEVARLQPDAARMIITGWNEEIAPADLERVGVQAVLSKPWDDADLKLALRKAMGG
ncbi:MAG: response regulator [Myxococcota bacterium]